MLIKLILVVLFLVLNVNAKIYQIGFTQDTLANDWRKAQVDEAVATAKDYQFLSITTKDAKNSVGMQVMHIEEFIAKGYDFILISPIDSPVIVKALQKAMASGVKVILISRGITGDAYTTFIRPDNKQIGKMAAQFILPKVGANGMILMLQGIAGATTTAEREEGFDEIVASSYPDVKVIKRRANFLRSDAIKVMQDIYQNGIHFDAIYSHSDSMINGALVVKKAVKDNRDIPIVGIDYITDAKQAIIAGEQSASFTYPTMAKEGIEAIVDIINNKTVPRDIIVDTTLVTKENVDQIKPIF